WGKNRTTCWYSTARLLSTACLSHWKNPELRKSDSGLRVMRNPAFIEPISATPASEGEPDAKTTPAPEIGFRQQGETRLPVQAEVDGRAIDFVVQTDHAVYAQIQAGIFV